MTPEQRRHLMDHELCHAEFAYDDGGLKLDERGRAVTRIRGHDVEEFRECVRRHGYNVHTSLQAMAHEVLKHADRDGGILFNPATGEVLAEAPGDGHPDPDGTLDA